MRFSHLYRGDALPALADFDALVVMGGEMNIYQDRDWPLKPERAFIAATLKADKRIVGICLGAQLLADALGARVVQNPDHEIGWLPVTWTNGARNVFPDLASHLTVLHWHGDTFSLPEGAARLASSEACMEQGFFIRDKCLALQFHLEVDPGLVKQFVESQGNWPRGAFVQKPDQILNAATNFCNANRALMHRMLDRFFS